MPRLSGKIAAPCDAKYVRLVQHLEEKRFRLWNIAGESW
jgi:hypothetical protein